MCGVQCAKFFLFLFKFFTKTRQLALSEIGQNDVKVNPFSEC